MNRHFLLRNRILRINPKGGVISSPRAEEICKKLGIHDEIMRRTSYLPLGKYSRRLFHLINSIDSIPKCSNRLCNENAVFLEFSRGYQPYCSRNCRKSGRIDN